MTSSKRAARPSKDEIMQIKFASVHKLAVFSIAGSVPVSDLCDRATAMLFPIFPILSSAPMIQPIVFASLQNIDHPWKLYPNTLYSDCSNNFDILKTFQSMVQAKKVEFISNSDMISVKNIRERFHQVLRSDATEIVFSFVDHASLKSADVPGSNRFKPKDLASMIMNSELAKKHLLLIFESCFSFSFIQKTLSYITAGLKYTIIFTSTSGVEECSTTRVIFDPSCETPEAYPFSICLNAFSKAIFQEVKRDPAQTLGSLFQHLSSYTSIDSNAPFHPCWFGNKNLFQTQVSLWFGAGFSQQLFWPAYFDNQSKIGLALDDYRPQDTPAENDSWLAPNLSSMILPARINLFINEDSYQKKSSIPGEIFFKYDPMSVLTALARIHPKYQPHVFHRHLGSSLSPDFSEAFYFLKKNFPSCQTDRIFVDINNFLCVYSLSDLYESLNQIKTLLSIPDEKSEILIPNK